MVTNSVWCQNQNYLSRCTTSHIKFGPEDNIMISAAPSSWRPLIKGFQVIRQNPLWLHRFEGSKLLLMWIIRVHVSYESWEKEFLNLKIFSWLKIDWKWRKFQAQKNPCSPLFPLFLMKSPKNMNKNALEFEIISWPFFDFGQKSWF